MPATMSSLHVLPASCCWSGDPVSSKTKGATGGGRGTSQGTGRGRVKSRRCSEDCCSRSQSRQQRGECTSKPSWHRLIRNMVLSSGACARRRLCSTGDLSRRQRRRASLSQKRSQRSGRATSLGMRRAHFASPTTPSPKAERRKPTSSPARIADAPCPTPCAGEGRSRCCCRRSGGGGGERATVAQRKGRNRGERRAGEQGKDHRGADPSRPPEATCSVRSGLLAEPDTPAARPARRVPQAPPEAPKSWNKGEISGDVVKQNKAKAEEALAKVAAPPDAKARAAAPLARRGAGGGGNPGAATRHGNPAQKPGTETRHGNPGDGVQPGGAGVNRPGEQGASGPPRFRQLYRPAAQPEASWRRGTAEKEQEAFFAGAAAASRGSAAARRPARRRRRRLPSGQKRRRRRRRLRRRRGRRLRSGTLQSSDPPCGSRRRRRRRPSGAADCLLSILRQWLFISAGPPRPPAAL